MRQLPELGNKLFIIEATYLRREVTVHQPYEHPGLVIPVHADSKLAAWTMLGNQLLNLDEALTK